MSRARSRKVKQRGPAGGRKKNEKQREPEAQKVNTNSGRRGGSSVKGRDDGRAYMAGTGVWVTRGDAVLIAPILRCHHSTYYAPIYSIAPGTYTDQDLPIAPSQRPENRGDSVGRGVRNAAHDEQGSSRRPCPAHPAHLAVGHRVREYVGLASVSIVQNQELTRARTGVTVWIHLINFTRSPVPRSGRYRSRSLRI